MTVRIICSDYGEGFVSEEMARKAYRVIQNADFDFNQYCGLPKEMAVPHEWTNDEDAGSEEMDTWDSYENQECLETFSDPESSDSDSDTEPLVEVQLERSLK